MAARRYPTPELVEAVRVALEIGMSIAAVCGSLGMQPGTFYKWREKGRKDDAQEAYANFATAVDGARAFLQERALVPIWEAIEGQGEKKFKDWRAAAWFLERRFPHEFGALVKDAEVSTERVKRVILERPELVAGARKKKPEEGEEQA